MLRRVFSTFVPALLALAFLGGAPVVGVAGPEASATSWTAAPGTSHVPTAPTARGSLTQDTPDTAVNQRTDQDDTPDDRIVRAVTTIVWPDSALRTPILHASDVVRPTHRPCAAPPRGPPTA
jgi:hypothetical protein